MIAEQTKNALRPWWAPCPYLRTYRPRKRDTDWMAPMVVVRFKVMGRWHSSRYTLRSYIEYRARCRAEHSGWDGKPAFVIGSLAS